MQIQYRIMLKSIYIYIYNFFIFFRIYCRFDWRRYNRWRSMCSNDIQRTWRIEWKRLQCMVGISWGFRNTFVHVYLHTTFIPLEICSENCVIKMSFSAKKLSFTWNITIIRQTPSNSIQTIFMGHSCRMWLYQESINCQKARANNTLKKIYFA